MVMAVENSSQEVTNKNAFEAQSRPSVKGYTRKEYYNIYMILNILLHILSTFCTDFRIFFRNFQLLF